MWARRAILGCAVAAVLVASAAGCGDGSAPFGSPRDVAVRGTPLPIPTTFPTAEGPVRNLGLATILSAGQDDAVLCLRADVGTQPSECPVPIEIDWDWAAHPARSTDGDGVRRAEYQVRGHFDGTRFTVEDAWDFEFYPEPQVLLPAREIPCPEPAKGWRAGTGPRATQEALDAATAATARLPGFGEAWVSPWEQVLVVTVTEDVAGAERAVRSTWSGALCVARAKRSLNDLQTIRDRVADLPGVIGIGVVEDRVHASVVHDDGAFQSWADREFGRDVVWISSALVPASG